MGFDRLIKSLESMGVAFSENEPMYKHTTFKIGGPARVLASPAGANELVGILTACMEHNLPYKVIGNGSNLLVDDAGVPAVLISTTKVKGWSRRGNYLSAAAGESLSSLCCAACDEGLAGIEFAFGIPGSLGGAVFMNAGAYGGEIKDVVSEALVFNTKTGKKETIGAQALRFGYRQSVFMQSALVMLEAHLSLIPGDASKIQADMQGIMARRKDKQPLDCPSAGSAFKRPEGAYAAELIDRCGLKGYRVGGAVVSAKHAGFIVNTGGATCTDVLSLMNSVKEIVKSKTGFVLEPEIQVIR